MRFVHTTSVHYADMTQSNASALLAKNKKRHIGFAKTLIHTKQNRKNAYTFHKLDKLVN